MSKSSWTFTTIENGEAVETVRGLDREQAVDAIRAAMYGEAPKPAENRFEQWVEENTDTHEQVAIAA